MAACICEVYVMANIKPNITFDGTMTDPAHTREKEDTSQLGKGGPPCAPPARSAAETVARAGGCCPPAPPASFFQCILVDFGSEYM